MSDILVSALVSFLVSVSIWGIYFAVTEILHRKGR